MTTNSPPDSGSNRLAATAVRKDSRLPLAWVLLAVAFVLLGTAGYYIGKVASLAQENRNSAVIFKQSLKASIDQFEYLPALLARDERLRDMLTGRVNNQDFINQYLRFTAERSGADIVYAMDARGEVLAASNYLDNSSFLDENYAFRPYFHRARDFRSRQFYFAKGTTTGIPGFFISAPVFENDEFIGVVTVKLELESLTRSWESAAQRVMVTDHRGVVIITSEPDWQYQLIAPLSLQQREQLISERQFPDEDPAMLFQKSASLGWFSDTDLWHIGRDAWLVNHSPIEGMDWTMHQVKRQSELVLPTMVCFAVLTLVAVLWLLFMIERRKKARYRASIRQAETQRREDLQRLIDNIHIGVLVCSADGRISSMNDYAENLLLAGADFRDGQQVSVVDLLQIPSLQTLQSPVALQQQAPQYAETWTRIGGQPVPVMFAVSPVVYDNREHYLVTLINIAKRKRAEDELVKLNASLEETISERTRELETAQQALLQKSKAAALGKMAGTIVHELSQPLSAMNSSVAALEYKLKRENWQGAAQSASRLKPLSSKMEKVVRMLKHFSYGESEQLEAIDLLAVVEQVVEVSADQLTERGVQLNIHQQLPAEHGKVMGSALKLDLAVSNLLKNALDAVADCAEPTINIGLREDNGELLLTLADNGGGIDSAIMGQLFNPYVTTKEVGKGIGLGLSITQEIVQQMQGTLDVCNRDGGACFTLRLPLIR